jgi:hypothetical protein
MKFVFPADKGGAPGLLIQKSSSVEYDEKDRPINRQSSTARYKWKPEARKFVKI